MKLTRVQRSRNLSEKVSEQVVSEIISGALKPGDRLPPEAELCESLGVGRSSLREGLRPLVLLGLIQMRPGEGTSVSDNPADFFAKPLSWGLLIGEQDVSQLIEARQLLELGIVSLAAERVTDAEVENLGGLLERMEEHPHDPLGRLTHDLSFHAKLAEASHNAVLARLSLSMTSLLRPWIEKVASSDPGDEAIHLHRQVFEAVKRRDPAGAQAAMARHTKIWEAQLMELMSMKDDGA